jgi:hypothetical protein
VEGGLFNGKKLFDAIETSGRKELEKFLKFIVARSGKYACNTWKLSDIFAIWMINQTPQAIED